MLYKGFKRDFLMFLAVLGDLAQEISYDTTYKRLYWPNYKPTSICQTVSRTLRTKEIEKMLVNGEPVLKLTTKGSRLLDEVIPLRKLAQRKWDGVWRMVIFDIKEKNRYLRNQLREKLKSLGFGKWQRSVYITPHDVLREMNEFLQEKRLFPRCVCLEARKVGVSDEKALATYVFKLEELSREYEKIADDSLELRLEIKEGKVRKQPGVAKFKEIWMAYKGIILKDPFLPSELLPAYWPAEDAQKEFSDLAKVIKKLG